MKNKIKFYLANLILIGYSYNTLAQNPTDCTDAIVVCGNSSVNLDVSGVGTQELLTGSNTCSSRENNSVWLTVTVATAGTLGFTLSPNSSDIQEDYDFFVFGPSVSCSNIGQAIRCSTTNPLAAGQGNNRTGMNGSSTDTAEGPGADGNSFVRWIDAQAGDTYFFVIDRPIGNSPFSLEWTGTATFSDPPTDQSNPTTRATNLESCDIVAPFDNELTAFNLEQNTALILGSQANTIVTYHATESDANIGINDIASPYTNIRNPQTIYARVTDTVTNCFHITTFNLNVNIGADFSPPTSYQLCDNDNDGNRNNGQVIFDLQSKNPEILNGQNPTGFNISYHGSQLDADNNTNPLPNLYYNTSPLRETIFFRIEDGLNTECKSVSTLDLIVNVLPNAFNHTILQCDEDGTLDGITQFNLNEANEILTGGVTNTSTRFYEDIDRLNEINGSDYFNNNNPQIIYVEVINNNTGCSSFSELTLEVSLTDSNNTQLTLCDDDIEDGIQVFNLNDANADIVSGLPAGLEISYFETYEDALLETNQLNDAYTNTIPYNQTIYARVEDANNCYGISNVELIINELPDIEKEFTNLYCLNQFPQRIIIDAGIENDTPSNYTYQWLTGENTYEIQVNEIGEYTVDVINDNGCLKNRTITVEASNIAIIESIEITDATQNNIITVIATGEGIYEYALYNQEDVIIEPFQEDNTFNNVKPGIYSVRVRDIKNNCGEVNNLISVIGFPKFFTPNNDGVNDTWQIYGISNTFQPKTKILIFNRHGKLLKEINALGKGWNGFYNGERVPSDDYWFEVKLQDGRIFKNHFSLKY